MSFETEKLLLLVGLALFTVVFVSYGIASLRRLRRLGRTVRPPTAFEALVGFVTDFFDTLGIGCFAPTTSIFKFKKMVPDENIPGTLNIGHTLPTLAEAFIFIAIVKVDPTTLLAMIGAAVLGSWLGAGVVAGWSRRSVQRGMGIALLVAAAFFVMKNLHLHLLEGDDVGTLKLEGTLFWAGIVGNFVLGALMTLGIGLYAPCMALVGLLGMNPQAAFPIMMGSCAFLMPIASIRFMQKERYSIGPALGLALGGIPGVLVAAYFVKSLPLTGLRWVVMIVVLYAAITMLRSAAAPEGEKPEEKAAAEGAMP